MAEQTLEEYLAALEMERIKLNIKIEGVRQALGLGPAADTNGSIASMMGTTGPTTTTPGSMRSDEFFQMSIPEAIKRYLAIMKQPQQPRAISEALKTHGLLTNSRRFDATVQTALARLSDSNEVVNVSGKGWGLFEWYKGRAGIGKEQPKKRKGPRKKASKKAGASPKGSKGKEASSDPSESSGKPLTWDRFKAEQLKAGKKMSELGELWRKYKETLN